MSPFPLHFSASGQVFGGVGHGGSIVAGLDGFKAGRARGIMEGEGS